MPKKYPPCTVPGCDEVVAHPAHLRTLLHLRNTAHHKDQATVTSLIREEEQTRLASDPRRLDIWQAFIKTSKVWKGFDVNKYVLAHVPASTAAGYSKDSPYLTLLSVDNLPPNPWARVNTSPQMNNDLGLQGDNIITDLFVRDLGMSTKVSPRSPPNAVVSWLTEVPKAVTAFVHTARKNSVQVIMAMAIARYVQGPFDAIKDVGKLFKCWRDVSKAFAFKSNPIEDLAPLVSDPFAVDEVIRQTRLCLIKAFGIPSEAVSSVILLKGLNTNLFSRLMVSLVGSKLGRIKFHPHESANTRQINQKRADVTRVMRGWEHDWLAVRGDGRDGPDVKAVLEEVRNIHFVGKELVEVEDALLKAPSGSVEFKDFVRFLDPWSHYKGRPEASIARTCLQQYAVDEELRMEKESCGESGGGSSGGSSGRPGGWRRAGGNGVGRTGRADAWSQTEIEALHKAIKACGGKLNLKLAGEIFDNVAELAKRSPRAVLSKYQSLGTLATQATDNNNSDSDSDHSAYSNVARKASRAEMHMDIDNNSEYDSDNSVVASREMQMDIDNNSDSDSSHSAYSNVARKASRVKLNRRIIVDINSDSDSGHSAYSNVARKASRAKLNRRIVVDSDSD